MFDHVLLVIVGVLQLICVCLLVVVWRREIGAVYEKERSSVPEEAVRETADNGQIERGICREMLVRRTCEEHGVGIVDDEDEWKD